MKCQCVCECNRFLDAGMRGTEAICFMCQSGIHSGDKLEDIEWNPTSSKNYGHGSNGGY